MQENSQTDKKSLRALTKKNPDWNELAKDAVCFANAFGGHLVFGIEDHAGAPPPGQTIPDDLVRKLIKNIQQRTLNVSVIPQVLTHSNGGQYIDVLVQRTASTVACTSSGRYYIRVEDDCRPVMPDELPRLIADKSAFVWELQSYLKVNRHDYDEVVVRELLANALVHRPYTIRGEIFINLYPDRMEVHNPGTFPLGVTPQNILHKSVQRNPYLAKVFYDLKLMEKEGSGYDKIYATLLSAGKPLPRPAETRDRVSVTVEKRIVRKEIIRFMEMVEKHYSLKLKEVISLGLIAQNTSLTAIEFVKILDLDETNGVRSWLGGLIELGLLKQKGRTKGTTYYVDPELLRELEYQGPTNLKNIAAHRLRALIKEDLSIYGESAISEIRIRIGKEIPLRSVKSQLDNLLEADEISKKGKKRGTKYFINDNL